MMRPLESVVLAVAIGISISCPAFAASSAVDVPIEKLLDKPVPSVYFLEGNDFHDLCAQLRIPCGQERLPDEFAARKDVFVHLERMTLRDHLERIVREYPQYEWSIQDGVLMMRPKELDRPSVLEKRIALFERRDQDFFQIVDDIAYMEWIRIVQYLTVGAVRNPDESTASRYKKFDLRCENATLREILNRATRTHGHAMWIYGYAPKSRFIPNFLRRGNITSYTY